MRRLILLSICLVLTISLYGQMASYWTRYDDMKAIMDSLALERPNFIMIENLGTTETDNLPIWGVRISNNAHTRQDRPRVLIVGSIHSEEVIGNEIALRLMRDMVRKYNQEPYERWLAQLEVWIVPTMNPEGLQVVMDGWDTSFRKNKRDNNGNGIFDFDPRVGYDWDGVDLNSNWDTGWVHADTLGEISGLEVYDYYRGPAPFSEAETKAIRDLAIREKFVYGICYHSSRTGNFAEQVLIPYRFANIRVAPDWDINNNIGQRIAGNIVNDAGTGYYSAFAALSRRGQQHTWLYINLGTIFFLIECGTSNIQPSLNVLNRTINNNNGGLYWLLNRASTSSAIIEPDQKGGLRGRVFDNSTGEPLVAEVIIHERDSKVLKPRMTCAEFGRFYRPLLSGNYTFTVRQKGYQPFTQTTTVPSSGWRSFNDIRLTPLEPITINIEIMSNGTPIPAYVSISDPMGDDIYETDNGFVTINTWVGERTITVIPETGIPYQYTTTISESFNLQVNIGSANVLFSDNFSEDLFQWDVNGPWQIVTDGGRNFLTDSWGGKGFYARACDVNVTTRFPVSIPAGQETYLIFDQHIYTEWDFDFVTVSASTDTLNWIELYREAGQYDWWHPNLLNLTQFAGEHIYLRFRLQDDTANGAGIDALVDPGWSIDNVRVVSGISVSQVDFDLEKPFVYLNHNYPNPFNPETKISFTFKNKSFQTAHIDIFNVKGQRVQRLPISETDVKNSYVVWNAEKLASGVYFYRLSVDNQSYGARKALLLK